MAQHSRSLMAEDGQILPNLSEPSWKGPSMERLRQEGLGAGIDITKPEKMLNTQIIPTSNNVDRRMFGTTYQQFFESIQTMSDVTRGLSANTGLEAVEVSFNVGLEFQRKELSRTSMTAIGKQIRNETVFFKDSVPGSDILLENFLREEMESKGFRNCCGEVIPEEERDKICKHVVRNRNHGATHYIASVDLGAKVYQVNAECEEVNEERRDGYASWGGGVSTLKGMVSVDFSEETKTMAKQCRGQTYFVVDKTVRLKGHETNIKTEQEKTIAYQMKPIWDLIKDKAWCEAVKKACKEYVEEMTPISVHSEQKVVIKSCGSDTCQYLKVSDCVLDGTTVKRVEGTADRSGAGLFFLVCDEEKKVPTEPGAHFYLCYSGGDDAARLYLTIDHKSSTVVLQDCVCGDQGLFSLARPCGEKPEAICTWQERKPLLLVGSYHKHTLLGLTSKEVERHLVLEQSSEGNPNILKLTNTKHPRRAIVRCQFALERP